MPREHRDDVPLASFGREPDGPSAVSLGTTRKVTNRLEMVRALSGSRPFATSRGVSSTCDPLGYDDFLRELKARIRNAQVKAAVAVNSELVLLYWRMGRDIRLRLATEGWGTQVIDRLSADLRASFPDMEGFTSDACSSAPRAAWSFT